MRWTSPPLITDHLPSDSNQGPGHEGSPSVPINPPLLVGVEGGVVVRLPETPVPPNRSRLPTTTVVVSPVSLETPGTLGP